MAEASGGSGVSKAVFFAEAEGGASKSFTVQYNPKDFKFDKKVSWKEHDDQGQEGSLEFQKATPATMSMELITAGGRPSRTTRSARPRRPKATHSLKGPAAVFPERYYEKLLAGGRRRHIVGLGPVFSPLASTRAFLTIYKVGRRPPDNHKRTSWPPELSTRRRPCPVWERRHHDTA